MAPQGLTRQNRHSETGDARATGAQLLFDR
jgi:hypothetical protein